MLIVTAAAAIALAQQAQTPPIPPLASAGQAEAPDTLALATQLRGESRDEAWASRVEAELTRAYQALPNAASAGSMAVTCGLTLCEIVGQAKPDANPQAVSALVSELQSGAAIEPARGLGLEHLVGTFGTTGEPQRVGFVVYWRRGG
ncbi:hypothetical protein [Brevundimonas sp.]|uniref:hypothetical protein n=1 Tax=Brevundimonas sp. TaxID=1871086 RepID=UPI0035B2819E